ADLHALRVVDECLGHVRDEARVGGQRNARPRRRLAGITPTPLARTAGLSTASTVTASTVTAWRVPSTTGTSAAVAWSSSGRGSIAGGNLARRLLRVFAGAVAAGVGGV